MKKVLLAAACAAAFVTPALAQQAPTDPVGQARIVCGRVDNCLKLITSNTAPFLMSCTRVWAQNLSNFRGEHNEIASPADYRDCDQLFGSIVAERAEIARLQAIQQDSRFAAH